MLAPHRFVSRSLVNKAVTTRRRALPKEKGSHPNGKRAWSKIFSDPQKTRSPYFLDPRLKVAEKSESTDWLILGNLLVSLDKIWVKWTSENGAMTSYSIIKHPERRRNEIKREESMFAFITSCLFRLLRSLIIKFGKSRLLRPSCFVFKDEGSWREWNWKMQKWCIKQRSQICRKLAAGMPCICF